MPKQKAKKRKVFLMIELDADELACIPPHLRGIVTRPLVVPTQTRGATSESWFQMSDEEKARRLEEQAARQKGEK